MRQGITNPKHLPPGGKQHQTTRNICQQVRQQGRHLGIMILGLARICAHHGHAQDCLPSIFKGTGQGPEAVIRAYAGAGLKAPKVTTHCQCRGGQDSAKTARPEQVPEGIVDRHRAGAELHLRITKRNPAGSGWLPRRISKLVVLPQAGAAGQPSIDGRQHGQPVLQLFMEGIAVGQPIINSRLDLAGLAVQALHGLVNGFTAGHQRRVG